MMTTIDNRTDDQLEADEFCLTFRDQIDNKTILRRRPDCFVQHTGMNFTLAHTMKLRSKMMRRYIDACKDQSMADMMKDSIHQRKIPNTSYNPIKVEDSYEICQGVDGSGSRTEAITAALEKL